MFWLGNLTGRKHYEDLRIDERLILNWILKKYNRKDLACIHLHQDRDRWQEIS
jgi:hypothetical protein